MATKYYGINDKWTDDSLENVIEVASEDGTVSSVKVNGVEYGGGGGGVPTCTVEIINTTAEEVEVDIVYLEYGSLMLGDYFEKPYYAVPNSTVNVTSIASEYSKAIAPGHTLTVSGMITYDELKQVATINGDGSITIN